MSGGERRVRISFARMLDLWFPTFLVGTGPVRHGVWIVKNRTVCRVERKRALRFPGDV